MSDGAGKVRARLKQMNGELATLGKSFEEMRKAADDAGDVLATTLDRIDAAEAGLKDEDRTIDERNDNLERVMQREIDAFITAAKQVSRHTTLMGYTKLYFDRWDQVEDELKSIRIRKLDPPPKRKADPAKAAKLRGIKDAATLKKAMEAAIDGDDAEATKLLQQIAKEEAMKDKASDLRKELKRNKLV